MASQDNTQIEKKPENMDTCLDEVVDDKDLMSIVGKITNQLTFLAVELGLTTEESYAVGKDHSGDHAEISFQMLIKWKRMKGGDATKGVLIKALEKVDLESAAVLLRASNR